ncbi:uncharacterized protein LOC107981823 [Nasonia vitripennis]|uniref:Uncharacterized protein n=1 Tax=Nasonia vitripennis TaxID=7425 RepID=A0A7M7PVW8_NASVI|nr:uncharacterized protein LOC107981823 [Nasonia vitripennis]
MIIESKQIVHKYYYNQLVNVPRPAGLLMTIDSLLQSAHFILISRPIGWVTNISVSIGLLKNAVITSKCRISRSFLAEYAKRILIVEYPCNWRENIVIVNAPDLSLKP